MNLNRLRSISSPSPRCTRIQEITSTKFKMFWGRTHRPAPLPYLHPLLQKWMVGKPCLPTIWVHNSETSSSLTSGQLKPYTPPTQTKNLFRLHLGLWRKAKHLALNAAFNFSSKPLKQCGFGRVEWSSLEYLPEYLVFVYLKDPH